MENYMTMMESIMRWQCCSQLFPQMNNEGRKDQDVGDDIVVQDLDLSLGNYTSKPDKTKKPEDFKFEYLKDNIIMKKKANVVAASAGTGKGLLSIDIGNSDKVKKPLYITLEDYGASQKGRYDVGLKNTDARIMNQSDFSNFRKTFEKSINYKLSNAAKIEALSEGDPRYIFMKRYNRINRRLKKSYGINIEKMNSSQLCFHYLIEQALDEGCDLIVLDSFLALQSGKIFNRKQLENIIIPIVEAGCTLVIIHHLNSSGDLHGMKELENIVDAVYKMTKIGTDDDSGDDLLKIDILKNRFDNSHQPLFYRKVKVNEVVADFRLIDMDESIEKETSLSIKNLMRNILENWPELTINKEKLIEKIRESLPEVEVPSIMNAVTNLKKKGLVSKQDNKTWSTILIN